MKVILTVVKMGGGYTKIILGQSYSPLTDRDEVDAIIGRDEDELIEKLKARLPGLRDKLRAALKNAKRSA